MNLWELANEYCPLLLLPAGAAFCLLSVPSARHPPLHSELVNRTRGVFTRTAEPGSPAFNHHCSESRKSQKSFTRRIASYVVVGESSTDWRQLFPPSWFLRLQAGELFARSFKRPHPACVRSTTFLSSFVLIRLILTRVNQFFFSFSKQMVGWKFQNITMSACCRLKMWPLIHFNPISLAGSLTGMKHPPIQRKCENPPLTKGLKINSLWVFARGPFTHWARSELVSAAIRLFWLLFYLSPLFKLKKAQAVPK